MRSGAAIDHFRRPSPQLSLGQALRGRATACIDISDGVLADLGHILAASGNLGACLQKDALPRATAVLAGCSEEEQLRLQLQGGDDYLLLFTLPAQEKLPPGCYCLGAVEQQEGLRLAAPDGTLTTLQASGWQHF